MSKYTCWYFVHILDYRSGTGLHSVFESEKHIQTFVLCELSLCDATVQVSQLLGSDGELGVHLCHLPVKCTPSLWLCRLKRSQKQTSLKFWHLCFAFRRMLGYLIKENVLSLSLFFRDLYKLLQMIILCRMILSSHKTCFSYAVIFYKFIFNNY